MNKKRDKKKLIDLLLRYLLLLIFAFVGANIFYFIFEPLTIYPSYFLFNLFYNPYLFGNVIHFYDFLISFEVVRACIAGSAYLLFFILNLSTPNIKTKTRIKILAISFASFLILNILRIFLVGVLFLENFAFAEIVHKLFWYFGSTIFIILVWFLEVKKFKIKEIPFYSDIKFLIKYIK